MQIKIVLPEMWKAEKRCFRLLKYDEGWVEQNYYLLLEGQRLEGNVYTSDQMLQEWN